MSDEHSESSFDAEDSLLVREKGTASDQYTYVPRTHQVLLHRRWLTAMGTLVAVLLCSNISLVVLLLQQAHESKFGTFENGFSTDMEPAKIAIEAVRQPFTGELKRHANGTLYRDMPLPHYFGEPSEEIDHNWDRLIYASGIDLDDDEIEQTGLKGKTWEEPQGNLWRTGLDVFHQLHCLNMIRKSFYPVYYEIMHDVAIDDPPRLRNLHRDHCLDYIRQALMCNADATPVRLEWDYHSHYLIPKFDQLHTCRNFELLHGWARARALEKTHNESTRLIDEMKDAGVL